jgi:hypothetical protein
MKVYIIVKAGAFGSNSTIEGVYSSKKAATDKLVELGAEDNYDYEIVEEYVDD